MHYGYQEINIQQKKNKKEEEEFTFIKFSDRK